MSTAADVACERCERPVENDRHTPCCSSHGKMLCCQCYSTTHFVETGCCGPQFVTKAASVMSTATLPAVDERTDLEVVEALEFEVACQAPCHPAGTHGHTGPAWALIANYCPVCGVGGNGFICRGGWDFAGQPGISMMCGECGHVCKRVEAWRIIELVRP